MNTNCLNHNTFTYKLLEKAFGRTQTYVIMENDTEFTLDDVFKDKDINEISVESIMTATKEKGKFDYVSQREQFNYLVQTTNLTIPRTYLPHKVVVDHVKQWFGVDLFDESVREEVITYEELQDYLKIQNTGSVVTSSLLAIMKPYISTSSEFFPKLGLTPITIKFRRLEDVDSLEKIQEQAEKRTATLGLFNEQTNTISIFFDTMSSRLISNNVKQFSDRLQHTLTHELAHALTLYQYRHTPAFGREIDALYNETIKQMSEEDKTRYGFKNSEEFIAEALVNPEFQLVLATIPYKTTQKSTISIWNYFIDLVSKFFKSTYGIDISGTILEATLETVTSRIEKVRRSDSESIEQPSSKTRNLQSVEHRVQAISSNPIENKILSYFWKTGVITKTKFQGKYWVKKGKGNILFTNLAILNRENIKTIAMYKIPKFIITHTDNSAYIDINPEYQNLVESGQLKKFKLSKQVNTLRSLESAQKWLQNRFGEDVAVHTFEDTLRIGDEFAHGWFDSAGIHLWNQSVVGTEQHEAFHVVFTLYNTEAQQQQLLTEARKKYGESLSDLELEERMADDYMKYSLNRNTKHLTGFQKLIEFFTDLFNYLSTYFTAKRRIEQIYSNIESNHINKQFKRSLSSLGVNKKYKRVRGFSAQSTKTIVQAAANIYLTKKADNLKESERKLKQALLNDTKNWFFTHAFTVNGGPIIDPKVFNELRKLWLATEQTFDTIEDEQDAFADYTEYLFENNIQPVATHGNTNEQKESNNSGFLKIFKTWDTVPDKFGNTSTTSGWNDLLKEYLKNHELNTVVQQAEEDKEDYDEEVYDGESNQERIHNQSHLEQNLRDKLSTEIKIFMRQLETPEVNFLGFKELYNFEDIYLDTILTLVRNNSFGFDTTTFVGMVDALNQMRETKPHLGIIADKLTEIEKTNPQFASKFFTNFATMYHKFIGISSEWSEEDKEFTIKIYEPNRKGLSQKLIDKWNINSISQPNRRNPNAIYSQNEEGELITNKKKVYRAVELFNELSSNVTEETLPDKVKALSNFLEIFGADISADHIMRFLNKGKFFEKEKYTGTKLYHLLIDGYSNRKDINILRLINHFTKTTGTDVKVIPTEDSIQDKVNNIYREYNTLFKRFAQIEALFTIENSGSFLNGKNKQVYPINSSTTESELFHDLKTGTITNEETSDFYKDKSFVPDKTDKTTKSIWLRVFENPELRDAFDYVDLDSFKEKHQTVSKYDYSDANDNISLIIRMNLFLNNGENMGIIPTPTLADRARMIGLKLPKFSENENLNTYSKNGIELTLDSIIRGYIQQDLQQIWQARKEIAEDGLPDELLREGWHYEKGTDNKRDGSGNAFKFWNLYGIDPNTMFFDETGQPLTANEYRNGENTKVPITLNSSEENFNLVDKVERDRVLSQLVEDFKDHIEVMITHQIEDMIKFNVIAGSINSAGVFTGKDFTGKTTTNLKSLSHSLNKKGLRQYKGTSLSDTIRSFVKDYIVNSIITSNELTHFTRGSRGYAKNYEDFNKRFGHVETPGTISVKQGTLPNNPEWGMPEYFYEAAIYDVMNDYKEADKLVASLKSVLEQNEHNLADNYARGKVNKSDAFGVITLEFGRSIMQGNTNSWTPSHEEAYINHQAGKPFKDNKGRSPVLMPLKSSYDGLVMIEDDVMKRPIMIKNSYQILIHDYTKDHPDVERLLTKMEESGVNAVNTITTRKLERHGMVDISQSDYTLTASKLPTKFFRIPQIIPNNEGKDLIGSQLKKVIISNIDPLSDYSIEGYNSNIKGAKVVEMFHDVLGEMMQQDYNNLMKELNFDKVIQYEDESLDPTKSELDKIIARNRFKKEHLLFLQNLKKKLTESIVSLDLSENYLKALDIVFDEKINLHRFRMPLSFPAYGRKFEQILINIFRSRVLQQRINGRNAVQIAELGGLAIQTKNEYQWSRYDENGYEVSTQGDKRFSALNAKLKDGRTIEEAYQLDVKGYRSQSNDWKFGKGKVPIRNISKEEAWIEYKGLWQQWANENPNLIKDLAEKTKNKVLTDRFASTDISQARALAEILSEINQTTTTHLGFIHGNKKVTTQKFITRQNLKDNPDTQYLFGDNSQQTGFGGQAKEMRGESNAFGIPTKKKPSNTTDSFFTDDELEDNKKVLDEAFAKIDKSKSIVIPEDGLGTGLADLKNKAPETFKYLQFKINQLSPIVAAECAVKWDIAAKFGIKPGQLLDGVIPEELRRIVGYRIPTGEKNAILPFVIKYVLPPSYEHAILVPGDIVTQMGTDFDVDKQYLIFPNLKVEGIEKFIDNSLKERGITNLDDFWTESNQTFRRNYRASQSIPENGMDEDQEIIKEIIDEFFSEKYNTTKNVHIEKIKPDWDQIISRDLSNQSREQLENAMLDIMFSILTNKEQLPNIIRPTDDNELKNEAALFRGTNTELDFNYPGTEQELEMRNKAGAIGVGTYANFLSGHNISQFTQIELEPIRVIYKVNGKIIAKETVGSLGRTRDIEGNLIATNLTRHMSAALDGVKDPKMFYINDNTITSNVTGYLESIGLPNVASTWFRMQPLIKEFTDLIKQRNASPSEYRSIKKELFNKYGISEDLVKDMIDPYNTGDYIPVLEINITQNADGTYSDIIDFDGIIDTQQGILLTQFIEFDRQGTLLVRLNKYLTPDRVKDMSSLAAIQSYEDVRAIVTKTLLGDYDVGKDYPSTTNYYEMGVNAAKRFFTSSGLFINTFTEANTDILKIITGKEIIPKRIYAKFHEEYMFFLYQLQSENKHIFTKEKFNELFEGKNNVVTTWTELRSEIPSLENNRFFNNFEVKYDPTSSYQILDFNTSLKMTGDQKNIMVDDLDAMLNTPEYYTDDVQLQQKLSIFAENLIYANFWQYGFSTQGTSIIDIIPLERFEDSKFTELINSRNNINMKDIDGVDLFLDNFMLNNVSLEGLITSKKIMPNDNSVALEDKGKTLVVKKTSAISPYDESKYTTYFKLYDKSAKEWIVYKLDKIDSKTNGVVRYIKLDKKGLAHRFKEYLVYLNSTSNDIYNQSIIKQEKVNQIEAEVADTETTSETLPEGAIKGIGDVVTYMASLSKQDRAKFREALANPLTNMKCKTL